MKKIVLALAGAASLLSSTPVLAQSANDAMRYDRAHDPAYQADRRIAFVGSVPNYGGYNNSPAYDVPVAAGGDSTCVLYGVFCTTHGPRPQAGENCFDGDGRMFALDRKKHWYYVEGSGVTRMNVGQVRAKCPWTTYEATAAAPAPAVVQMAAPSAPRGPIKVPYGDNYSLTVSFDANGQPYISSKEYNQR